KRLGSPWSDHRAERLLGAVSLLVGVVVVVMVVFVAIHAWPTFQHNGLGWLGSGGNLSTQISAMGATNAHPPPSAYHLNAWPLVYGTLLITAVSVVLGLLVAVAILTVMITPIMIALICEALVSVPSSWREGAIALGVNPLRAILAVTIRAARPAIVAAAVLATARALGEAIMISMVSGGSLFSPKPIDGLVFLF